MLLKAVGTNTRCAYVFLVDLCHWKTRGTNMVCQVVVVVAFLWSIWWVGRFRTNELMTTEQYGAVAAFSNVMIVVSKGLDIWIKLTKYLNSDENYMRLGIESKPQSPHREKKKIGYGNGRFIMIHLGNLTKAEQFNNSFCVSLSPKWNEIFPLFVRGWPTVFFIWKVLGFIA